MTNRERFYNVMEYREKDRVPNWEAGVWGQTIERWESEGLDIRDLHWDWFTGEEYLGMDGREFIPVNYDMIPHFQEEILERTDRYLIKRNRSGIVTKALLEGTARGTRSSMDQYLEFPVRDVESFRELKKRYDPSKQSRYPAQWRELRVKGWKERDHVLILGKNCSTLGFYWRAREWMGTENLSYAWYDQPKLLHEMMEFIADFTIEVSKPILEEVTPDYLMISEDMAMKNGPLLSPDTYRTFIFPHMKRMTEFFKSKGVSYIMVDTDGNSKPLVPLLLDAGVDGFWPLERAADMDPAEIRRKYGKDFRLWGGVDKRELAKTKEDIRKHLLTLQDLIAEGGFIPTVDHTVPPDVSLENFIYYMKLKKELLSGNLT